MYFLLVNQILNIHNFPHYTTENPHVIEVKFSTKIDIECVTASYFLYKTWQTKYFLPETLGLLHHMKKNMSFQFDGVLYILTELDG